MQPARSRFSHRHLLALSTFLVPLGLLAALGWSELRRTGASAQAALAREGRQFVTSARQAVEQRLDRWLPRMLDASIDVLDRLGPVRATNELCRQPDFAPLRGIVMLDERANLVWPALPLYSISLAFARDPQRGPGNVPALLQAADLLLTRGLPADAVQLLQPLVQRLVEANPPGAERRPSLLECEAQARFHLARAEQRLGRPDEARAQFTGALRLAETLGYPGRDLWVFGLGLLAETSLAELGGPGQRLALLRDIAENRRELGDDAQLSSVAQRLAASFAADDVLRPEVDDLLAQEARRAAIRTFGEAYETAIKPFVARRTRRSTSDVGASPLADPAEIERLVSTPEGAATMLVCIRPATAAEERRWRCARIAFQIDVQDLLADTWRQFQDAGGTFVLAVHDPDDTVLVPPPPATPASFVVPTDVTNDLTLRAYPADPARFVAEAEAAATQRTLLMLALFVTALGGALWSWRSVSRETELAALKIDLVSRVSHELKTPLALVRMYGETLGLGRARDPAQAAEFGGIIAREAERLTALIQRILDFSRQQAGTLTYAAEAIDLGELLRTVVATYAPHLEARGALVIDSLPLDILVHCDPNACESAIVNLLENAAKYSDDGTGEHEIELALERRGARAVIEVRDHGRGIPADERDRVFEGFYRASNAGEVRGAGLGLSLVRHFARAHGGEIHALARAGGGTVMRLTLPLATAAGSPDATTVTTPAAPAAIQDQP